MITYLLTYLHIVLCICRTQSSLDFVVNRFIKLFKTNNIDVVNCMQFNFGLLWSVTIAQRSKKIADKYRRVCKSFVFG